MHIRTIAIKKLRSIETAVIDWNLPGGKALKVPNVNVLLGNNGAGKSTILRAIALSAMGPGLESSGYRPYYMVRRAPKSTKARKAKPQDIATIKATIGLDAQDGIRANAAKKTAEFASEITIELMHDEEFVKSRLEKGVNEVLVRKAMFSSQSSGLFMVGYGATRRVEGAERIDESSRSKSRAKRYERVAGLFEDHVSLVPVSYWLPQFSSRNPGRYRQVINLLNEILPVDCRVIAAEKKVNVSGEQMFLMNNVPVPFAALSDGYKAYLSWIGDMLYHLCIGAPSGQKLRDVTGVALIDEIDLHLHPEWQMTALPTLAAALPNLQFIVTTHSPLVVGSLEAANLFFLERIGDVVTVKQLPERVHGATAEEILLSPYFGLHTTRSPEIANKLRLLAKSAAGTRNSSAAALTYIASLAKGGS